MMKICIIFVLLLLSPLAASAQSVLHSPPLWCEVGGQKVSLSGINSSNEVQRSIPLCSVTVYNAGSVNVASIFSDSLATPTPKANPFSALANGKIDFYAAASCYDIVTSGGSGSDTFPTPITYSGVCFGGSGGGGGGGGGGSVTSVGFSAPAGFSVSGSPVTGVGTLALSMPSGWTDQDLLIGNGTNSVTRLPKGANGTCLTMAAGVLTYGASPCVGIPAGTTNQIVKRADGPNSILSDSSLLDDGINPVQAPNGLSVMSSGLPRVITNATPATTVLNQLVERNAAGFAINASASSSRALGIAGQGAGVSGGAVQVISVGYGNCVFDNQTIINDYVVPSPTGGLCHDAGATRPLNAEVMGTVTSVNSGAATTAIVDFFTGDTSQTTPSAIAPCGSSPGPFAYYTAASTLGCDTLMLTDGSGNSTMSSLTLGGASAGYLFFTASSQPSFPVANSAYLFAPTSIPTTYALKLPSALGTSGQALAITGVASNVGTLGWTTAAGCPEGTCIVNAPTADQVITGAHALIISGGSVSMPPNAAGSVLAGNGSAFVSQTKPVLDVRDFAGANVGAQIQAAHDSASCPVSGCVIDTRGIGNAGTIAGLSITKPIVLEVGATTFSVSATLTITNVTAPSIRGAGPNVSVFNWTGNNSTPMLRLISVQRANFSGFSMNANSGTPLTAFITSERGATGNPTSNTFTDLVWQGTNGGVVDAFRWVMGAGGDAGNDTFAFYNVIASNYSHAAWNSDGQTQSQGHSFFNCQAQGGGFGQYGYYGNGSFAMYNQQFSVNSVSDIAITLQNNSVLVSNGLSIGSNRFFTDPATSGEFSVTIQNFNWNNMGLNADGRMIILSGRGPYVLTGNTFWGNNVAASIYLSSAIGHQSGTAIGNNFTTTLTTPFNDPAGATWLLLNNTIGIANPTNLADQFPNPIGFALDNTYDIGAAGANRPRTGYFGTSVVAPIVALSANITWTSGAGVPSGGSCTTAKGGSLYSRTDGDTTHTLYVCDNSTGVWTPK